MIKTTNQATGATLAFRPGEVRTYAGIRIPPDNPGVLYAVCLTEAPPWPWGNVQPQCRPLGVACLQFVTWGSDTSPSWGWVHLDPDAKAIIGEDLEDFGIALGTWIYMTIRQDRPPARALIDTRVLYETEAG